MTVFLRAMKAACIAGASTSTMAMAQSAPPPMTAPIEQSVDANGVDLVSGKLRTPFAALSIGDPSAGGIALRMSMDTPNSLDGNIVLNGSVYTVTIGGNAERFVSSGGVISPEVKSGSTLKMENGLWVYQTASGAKATFNPRYGRLYNQTTTGGTNPVGQPPSSNYAGIVSYVSPEGHFLSYTYTTVTHRAPSQYAPYFEFRRIQSITSSSGYQLKYSYASDTTANLFYNSSDMYAWSNRAKVLLLNDRTDSCAVTAYSCNVPNRPSFTFTGQVNGDYSQVLPASVTDAEGKVTTVTSGSGSVTIQPPGGVSALSYTLDGNGRVTQAVAGGVTASYGYSTDAEGLKVTTRTTPAGTETRRYDPTSLLLRKRTDLSGATTEYLYNSLLQLTSVVMPEGNRINYDPDDRGNAKSTSFVPKPGSSEPTLVSYAGYDASCTTATAKTCNLPNWTKDARGNADANDAAFRTNYSYVSTTGLVETIIGPAANAGGNRPKRTYSYTTTNGVTRLTGIVTCLTATDCSSTANERRVTMSYGTVQSNNSALQSTTVASGDNALVATTSYTYTPVGDVDTVDGPLAGSGDSVRTLYDLALRRAKGQVSPDPDGGGSAKPMATRYLYDTAGRLQRTERGVVDGAADSQWSTFQASSGQENVYDSHSRVIQSRANGGGTAASLTETSYDSAGRVDCVVQRMNAATLNDGYSNACAAKAAGNDGPDRITRTVYDIPNRQISTTSGYGTAEALTQTVLYNISGQEDWVRDGENNRTSYAYDGHGRLKRTSYPVGTRGADASSGSDYEELSYDAAGNVTSRRLRNGHSLGFTYNALNRVTKKTVPDGCAPIQVGTCAPAAATRDVDYVYDLAGRLTSATFSGTSEAVTAAYDALDRMTSTTTTMGGTSRTLGYQYNIAGNRTRITHPDGTAFGYEYDPLSRLKEIRDGVGGGITNLAYYNTGERQWLGQYANGIAGGYDQFGRLTSYNIERNQNGSILGDNTTLQYNPASQIKSQVRNNDAYGWTGAFNVDRSYTTNGLNQYTAAGPASMQYDANGNLVASGTTGYLYDPENRLIGNSQGVGLVYDSLGRLFETSTNGGNITRFLYDGDALVAEYNASGSLLWRYVHADSVDTPVLAYEGTSTSPRQLLADHQGSIVATTQLGWNLIGINTYDEYGIPGQNNIGRFQYTGQAWIPELGMYYYKARMYSPTLGRFLQTDPIGYADGINWYNYVGGDPVNGRDPTGTHLGPNPTQEEIAKYAAAQSIMARNAASRGSEVAGMSMALQDASRASAMLFEAAPYMKEIAEYHFIENSIGRLAENLSKASEFKSLKPGDITILKNILSTPSVRGTMASAIQQTKATGNERGFFIYQRMTNKIYFPGEMAKGNKTTVDVGSKFISPVMHVGGSAIAVAAYHTHPQNVPFPSVADVRFGVSSFWDVIMIIGLPNGRIVYGRGGTK